MPTINQLYRNGRHKKKKTCRLLSLEKCPQKKGVVLKLTERAPKKPNSAKRKIALVKLSNKKFVYGYIPGISEAHGLQEHSIILLRGGRVQDVPGLKYKIIRGKYDAAPVLNRKRGRSKYGVKRSKSLYN